MESACNVYWLSPYHFVMFLFKVKFLNIRKKEIVTIIVSVALLLCAHSLNVSKPPTIRIDGVDALTLSVTITAVV